MDWLDTLKAIPGQLRKQANKQGNHVSLTLTSSSLVNIQLSLYTELQSLPTGKRQAACILCRLWGGQAGRCTRNNLLLLLLCQLLLQQLLLVRRELLLLLSLLLLPQPGPVLECRRKPREAGRIELGLPRHLSGHRRGGLRLLGLLRLLRRRSGPALLLRLGSRRLLALPLLLRLLPLGRDRRPAHLQGRSGCYDQGSGDTTSRIGFRRLSRLGLM